MTFAQLKVQSITLDGVHRAASVSVFRKVTVLSRPSPVSIDQRLVIVDVQCVSPEAVTVVSSRGVTVSTFAIVRLTKVLDN